MATSDSAHTRILAQPMIEEWNKVGNNYARNARKTVVTLAILFAYLLFTAASALAFWQYITFGMWLYNELKSQTIREQGHEGTVSFLLYPQTEAERAFLGANFVVIMPTESGQNFRFVQGWKTDIRFFCPDSGHGVDKVLLQRGSTKLEEIDGDKLRLNGYVDFTLPEQFDINYVYGKAEHITATYFLGNGEKKSIIVSYVKLSLIDWYAQYLIANRMGNMLAQADRQLHPERTNMVHLNLPEKAGVTIHDGIVNQFGQPIPAVSQELPAGLHTFKVKGTQIKIQMADKGWTASPVPVAGFWTIADDGTTIIELRRIGGHKS